MRDPQVVQDGGSSVWECDYSARLAVLTVLLATSKSLWTIKRTPNPDPRPMLHRIPQPA